MTDYKRLAICSLILALIMFVLCEVSFGEEVCKPCLTIDGTGQTIDTCHPLQVCCNTRVNILVKTDDKWKVIVEDFDSEKRARMFIWMKKAFYGPKMTYSDYVSRCEYKIKPGFEKQGWEK